MRRWQDQNIHFYFSLNIQLFVEKFNTRTQIIIDLHIKHTLTIVSSSCEDVKADCTYACKNKWISQQSLTDDSQITSNRMCCVKEHKRFFNYCGSNYTHLQLIQRYIRVTNIKSLARQLFQQLKQYNDIQSDDDDEPILYTYKATNELVYCRIINVKYKLNCVHICSVHGK